MRLRIDNEVTNSTPSHNGSLLKTRSKIAAHCETLKNYFGHLKVADIRPSMVEQYRGERLKTESKHGKFYRPASINREVEVLKRMFNLAVRDKRAESNPCFKIARLPEDNIRSRVLSAEELKRLTAALPEHAAQLITIGVPDRYAVQRNSKSDLGQGELEAELFHSHGKRH